MSELSGTDARLDRIEALTAKVKLMDDLDAINGEKIEALEAKLAKAVEALDAAANWADQYRWAAPWVDDARATLAEIKGESQNGQ
jgi:CHASE3 domain sensor protein